MLGGSHFYQKKQKKPIGLNFWEKKINNWVDNYNNS